jgi:hypothetical protein
MNLATEIDVLLDAIDREISLLDRVTLEMSKDLDTQGTHEMARILSAWEPFQDFN